VGSSWAVVKYSSALARTRRAGSRRSVLWLAAVLLITVGMGLVTYYYHLHEPDDQDDQDENPSASISIPRTPAAGGYL
jgi:hypothetical protein